MNRPPHTLILHLVRAAPRGGRARFRVDGVWTAVLALFLIAGGCTPAGSTEESARAAAAESGGGVVSVGLDSVRIAEAFARASDLPRLRTLLVARHGELLAELHAGGPPPDVPVNVKSVSKSILSALVGIAIAEGHLSGAGQPIAGFFEEYLEPDGDPRKRSITIAHLLSMQSGLERTSGGNYGRWVTSPNWVRYAITRPMVAEPGGRRIYSTGNSHLLSAVLTEATGRSTWDYARSKLAEPLGIALPRWRTDPQGIYFGGNEMLLSPRAMVRIGELYRNGGRHGDRQIVPSWWVRESLTRWTPARRPGDGYGYSWFLSEVRGYPMFYAWGYGGQFIFVVPDLELTVVSTADTNVARGGSHLREVRRILADMIVPAALLGAGGTIADRPGSAS